MKRRNPRMGCRKIAEQISNAFGLAINKDVVRRILIEHYRPAPGGDGPSWLSVIGQAAFDNAAWPTLMAERRETRSKLQIGLNVATLAMPVPGAGGLRALFEVQCRKS